MQLVKDSPAMALRCFFHFPNGETDIHKAASHIGVEPETVAGWLDNDYVPDWVHGRLMIH